MTDASNLTAAATVVTATADRYAKQLASHLGRRCEVREESGGTRILLPDGGGDCLLVAAAGALELHAHAATQDDLGRVMDVVGSHLERFGQRDELQVHWQVG